MYRTTVKAFFSSSKGSTQKDITFGYQIVDGACMVEVIDMSEVIRKPLTTIPMANNVTSTHQLNCTGYPTMVELGEILHKLNQHKVKVDVVYYPGFCPPCFDVTMQPTVDTDSIKQIEGLSGISSRAVYGFS